MKTIVYQSYRTHDVPPWIERCMATVRAWAAARGFDYRFYDDALLERAPRWYRERASNNMLLVTDLARVIVARELLAEGYERTIWVDADLVVFDPSLDIAITSGYAFCAELFVGNTAQGCDFIAGVNNAISVYCAGNTFLDFYVETMQVIVRERRNLKPIDASTDFLSNLYDLAPFPLLQDVALLSPLVQFDLLAGGGPALDAQRRGQRGVAVKAANLCGSFRGRIEAGRPIDDAHYGAVVDRLLADRGACLNGPPPTGWATPAYTLTASLPRAAV